VRGTSQVLLLIKFLDEAI